MTLPKEVRKAREYVIIELRCNGLHSHDIAYELGLKVSLVRKIAQGLIKGGKLKRLSPGPKKSVVFRYAFWKDRENPKTQMVIAMVRARASQQKIANALGAISREYGRQIVRKMENFHGSNIWKG